MGDIFHLAYPFSDRFDIHGSGNIDSTMTDKNSKLSHNRFAEGLRIASLEDRCA
jgi:hypothetical protein